jgi:hypothetical protein
MTPPVTYSFSVGTQPSVAADESLSMNRSRSRAQAETIFNETEKGFFDTFDTTEVRRCGVTAVYGRGMSDQAALGRGV